jgi:hypothetical protein
MLRLHYNQCLLLRFLRVFVPSWQMHLLLP